MNFKLSIWCIFFQPKVNIAPPREEAGIKLQLSPIIVIYFFSSNASDRHWVLYALKHVWSSDRTRTRLGPGDQVDISTVVDESIIVLDVIVHSALFLEIISVQLPGMMSWRNATSMEQWCTFTLTKRRHRVNIHCHQMLKMSFFSSPQEMCMSSAWMCQLLLLPSTLCMAAGLQVLKKYCYMFGRQWSRLFRQGDHRGVCACRQLSQPLPRLSQPVGQSAPSQMNRFKSLKLCAHPTLTGPFVWL